MKMFKFSKMQRIFLRHKGAFLSTLLVVPSLFWVLVDEHPWPWDQSWYGQVSIDLWWMLSNDPAGWLSEMMHAFGIKAPALAWIGQFFVPLGPLFGSVDKALMIQIIIVQAAAIAVMFEVFRVLSRDTFGGILGVLTIAAAPLFAGMGHQYLVESLQLFSVACILLILVRSAMWNVYDVVLAYAFIAAYAVLVKVSSPLYILLPSMAILEALVRRRSECSIESFRTWLRRRRIGLIGCFTFMAGVAAWYIVNIREVMNFLELASSGDAAGLYGNKAPFLEKFRFWADATRQAFLPGQGVVVGVASFIVSILSITRRKKFDELSVSVAVAVASISLVLVVFSLQINEETRYLLPLAPYLGIIVVYGASQISNVFVKMVILVWFVLQYGVVHGSTLGIFPSPWSVNVWGSIVANRSDSVRNEIVETARRTCPAGAESRTNMVGVELPWVNANTLSFYADQVMLETRRKCYYTSAGYAETDIRKSLDRLTSVKAPFLITIDAIVGLDENDPFNAVSKRLITEVERRGSYRKEAPDFSEKIDIWMLQDSTIRP